MFRMSYFSKDARTMDRRARENVPPLFLLEKLLHGFFGMALWQINPYFYAVIDKNSIISQAECLHTFMTTYMIP